MKYIPKKKQLTKRKIKHAKDKKKKAKQSKMEKKCLQKNTGQFVLCWPSTPGMQPPSSVIDIPRESPLAKTGFSSVGFTLRLTSWVVMGLRVHFPLLGLGPHLVLYLLVWSVNSYVH